LIKYIKNQHINKLKWDDCIRNSVNARVYAYSWYLDIVTPEWDALILDDYQAVFPIIYNTKWKIDYCYQPVFTQQLGVFSSLLLTSDLVKRFLEKLQKQFPFIQINLNSHNKIEANYQGIKRNVNHELDLIQAYDDLKKGYSKNLKRNLKKASKNKLTIFKNLKPEVVVELFKDNKGKEIKAYNDQDYQKLIRLSYKALSLNMAHVWGVFTPENNICAAAIFMKDKRKHTFLFSGSNAEAKELLAMPYLLDSYIKAHSQVPVILDFEGSNDPNLARFYKSFGSTKIHYPHFFSNQLPWYFSLAWKLKQSL